jgi:hypothetical protein
MAFAGGEARVIRIAYDCMLAIRHHGRWWLQELGFVAGDRRFLGVDKMEVRGGDLIIRAQQSYWWHENDADITSWYTCAPWVMACTTAVCTAPLVYKYAARCEPESDEPSHPEWVFRNKLDIGDGWLALTPQPAHAARKLPKLWAPPQPPRPGVYRLP